MFRCSDHGCDEKFETQNELTVHRSYHDYHQKIRNEGRKELTKLEDKLQIILKCPLADRLEGCFYFPQLPTRLICEWSGCNCEFLSAEKFYNHVSNHSHRSVDKCYWENCNKVFKNVTITLLRDHLRVHTLQKLYACPYCGNFFSTKIKFDDHFLRHFNLDELLNEQEADFEKTTLQHGELKYNIEEYSIDNRKLKIFRCVNDNCDKTFITSSLLREHIRMHSNKNQCDQCPFIANSVSRLESHKLYRHQTERNYECSICLKTFKQRGDLRAHVRRHQIIEPYKCDKCDFETLNEEGLNKHMKLHSKNHDYCCHICRRVFSRGNNLSRHFREIHGLEPPNGLCRFRYKLTLSGIYFLESIDESVITALHESNHDYV